MNKNRPLITIGILTFNRKEALKETLKAINQSLYNNYEVIVVDNGSTDGIFDLLTKDYPWIKLIRLEKNLGISARNKFISEAQGEYIFQYDDDSMPQNRFTITNIVDFLKKHPEVCVLCTNVINYYTGMSETEGWEKYALRGNHSDGFEGLFFHDSGVVYKRDCVLKTQGYPFDFFWGYEEADLTLQFLNQGCKIVYKTDLITYHRRSLTGIGRGGKAKYYFTRNGIRVFCKYFPKVLANSLVLRWVLLWGLRSLKKPKDFPFFLKGLFDGLKESSKRKKQLLSQENILKSRNWQRQNLHFPLERIKSLFSFR